MMSDSMLPKTFVGFPELATRADEVSAALMALKSQVEKSEKYPQVIAHLRTKLDLAAAAKARLKADLDAAQAQITQFHAERGEGDSQNVALESLTRERDALQVELSNVTKAKEDAAAAHQHAVEMANATLSTLRSENKTQAERITSLEAASDGASAEIARLASDLSAQQAAPDPQTLLGGSNAQSAADLDVAQSEIKALQAQMQTLQANLETERAAKQSAEKQISTANARAVAAEQACETASQRLASLIDSLSAARSAGAA